MGNQQLRLLKSAFVRLYTQVVPGIVARHRRSALLILGSAMVVISLLTWRIATLPSFRQLVGIAPSQTRLTPIPRATETAIPSTVPQSSRIKQENQLAGTTDWKLTPNAAPLLIQGYAGSVSAAPGEVVPIFVSLATPGPFSIEIYRLGWYGGAGGRLVSSVQDLPGLNQGTWSPKRGLTGCSACLIDAKTGLIDANWQRSFALTIDPSWVTGVYLLKLAAANHAQSYIPLVVRDVTRHPAILLQLPVLTYQAYNIWGGASLYQRTALASVTGEESAKRATHVSFNRPYERSAGAGDLLSWDLATIRWIERNAYDVGYLTNVDFAQHPQALLQSQVFLSVGHDEYWTKAMRDGAEEARDQGVSLAFLGANDAYWQARLEADAQGHADRTIVCYKVATKAKTADMALTNDPLYALNPTLVTAQWRDPAIGRPENQLMGLMYRSYLRYQAGITTTVPDWVVKTGVPDLLFTGTGLTPGEHIRGGLLGYEYDGMFPDGKGAPAPLHILAESPVTNVYGIKEVAVTAYYRATSGALVFDAGSIWWGWGLDDLVVPFASQPNILKGNAKITLLTANILAEMLKKPAPNPPPAANR